MSRRLSLPFQIDWRLALVAVATLLLGIMYTLLYVVDVPYFGIVLDGQWRVLEYDDRCEVDPALCAPLGRGLQWGDRLLRIGDVTYEQFSTGRSFVPFGGYRPGNLVPLTFVRDGQVLETSWQLLPPTWSLQFQRFLTFLIFLPFWIAGTAVLLFLRPRDRAWSLLIVFNYLTAAWIAAGIVSSYRIGASALVLRTLTLFMPAVYLHLHLLVPVPILAARRRYLTYPLYLLAVVLTPLGIIGVLGSWVYNLASMIAVVGSVGLLLFRLNRPLAPGVHLATRLMLTGIALAFGPGLVAWIIPNFSSSSTVGQSANVITLGAISLLPFFYVYALYKHRLGELEFRANRLLSLFAFLALFITFFMLVFLAAAPAMGYEARDMAFALIVSVIFVTAGLFARPPFQRLIDRLAYGTEHNPDDIIRAFANQIPVALDRDALVGLLTREVAPSLLIRQSALYLVRRRQVSLFYASNAPDIDGPDAVQPVRRLLAGSGNYRPAEQDDPDPFAWVRLAIAIEVGRKPIGVWLLGRRDPDDYYPRADIALLTTLANQIGVALENASLFENLQHRAAELERAYHELQDLDRMKDEFVQNVSHELRTPLTIIHTTGELLLEEIVGELNADQRTMLDRLLDRTRSMVRLVNDILTLQQASLRHLGHEPVNLPALAQSCLQGAELVAQQPEYQGRTYRFVLEAPDDLPPVSGDGTRLRQVLDNLVGNAMKFSPNGGTIAIRLRGCQASAGNGQSAGAEEPAVEISVSDEGIGIAQSELERIWRRFYQVDGSSTRSFGGTGLGLAIARGIVNAHGGTIWAESGPGPGSTFHCILPVAALPSASLPAATLSAPTLQL